jgi:GNAT superfamily N-acetyltransferase
MWRPERFAVGPRPATEVDIPALNRIFSDSFTERYHRDGLVSVRVPQLNPDVWSYAIRDAGNGAMLWHDEQDQLVAFNVAHRSGTEGWMGPLAVRTDRQEMGLGRTIVTAAIEWLRNEGVSTIGLETMPRTVENIGFYGRLGFVPGHLTVTMSGEASRRRVAGGSMLLGRLEAGDRKVLTERCRVRVDQAAPGYDFTREVELTHELELGDTVVLERAGEIVGFSIWHAAPLAAERQSEELRVLKLFADSRETFERLMLTLEGLAARKHLPRVAVRMQTAHTAAYQVLIERGYRVRWTDLRMTLEGSPEATVPRGEVLLSNWEI